MRGASRKSGIKPTNAILYIITILFLVPSWQNIWSVLPVLLFILVVGESILLIFGKKTVEDISVSILTFVYITVALSSVIVVREASFDFIWYIFIFASLNFLKEILIYLSPISPALSSTVNLEIKTKSL